MEQLEQKDDKYAHAMSSGKATLDSIIEMVDALQKAEEEGDDKAFEEADQAIQEDPLSVEVREGWKSPGGKADTEEFRILLGTGGPAVQIVGTLGMFNLPDKAELQVQDWFLPWKRVPTTSEQDEKLLTYCRRFYFGD